MQDDSRRPLERGEVASSIRDSEPRAVALSVNGVSKAFRKGDRVTQVIKDFELCVCAREFVSVFGPNGCGKTTLLHIIAGIESADEGTVTFDRKSKEAVHVGMVFQDSDKTLLPWRTVIDNVAFPLERERGLSKSQRRAAARELLDTLNLTLPLGSYPYELSGGQKQLVNVARALIQRPQVLLLDEPFASLDYQTRLEMQATLERIWLVTGTTILFVSHEIDEAIVLADRFIFLSSLPGCIRRVFDVNLPRPRTVEVTTLPEFVELRQQILEEFLENA